MYRLHADHIYRLSPQQLRSSYYSSSCCSLVLLPVQHQKPYPSRCCSNLAYNTFAPATAPSTLSSTAAAANTSAAVIPLILPLLQQQQPCFHPPQQQQLHPLQQHLAQPTIIAAGNSELLFIFWLLFEQLRQPAASQM